MCRINEGGERLADSQPMPTLYTASITVITGSESDLSGAFQRSDRITFAPSWSRGRRAVTLRDSHICLEGLLPIVALNGEYKTLCHISRHRRAV